MLGSRNRKSSSITSVIISNKKINNKMQWIKNNCLDMYFAAIRDAIVSVPRKFTRWAHPPIDAAYIYISYSEGLESKKNFWYQMIKGYCVNIPQHMYILEIQNHAIYTLSHQGFQQSHLSTGMNNQTKDMYIFTLVMFTHWCNNLFLCSGVGADSQWIPHLNHQWLIY